MQKKYAKKLCKKMMHLTPTQQQFQTANKQDLVKTEADSQIKAFACRNFNDDS